MVRFNNNGSDNNHWKNDLVCARIKKILLLGDNNMTTFCPNCGFELTGKEKFCPRCGFALTPSAGVSTPNADQAQKSQADAKVSPENNAQPNQDAVSGNPSVGNSTGQGNSVAGNLSGQNNAPQSNYGGQANAGPQANQAQPNYGTQSNQAQGNFGAQPNQSQPNNRTQQNQTQPIYGAQPNQTQQNYNAQPNGNAQQNYGNQQANGPVQQPGQTAQYNNPNGNGAPASSFSAKVQKTLHGPNQKLIIILAVAVVAIVAVFSYTYFKMPSKLSGTYTSTVTAKSVGTMKQKITFKGKNFTWTVANQGIQEGTYEISGNELTLEANGEEIEATLKQGGRSFSIDMGDEVTEVLGDDITMSPFKK